MQLKEKNIKKYTIPFLKFKTMKELKLYNRIYSLFLINSELFNLINEQEEKIYQFEYLKMKYIHILILIYIY